MLENRNLSKIFLPDFLVWSDRARRVTELLFLAFSVRFFYKNFRKYYYSQNSLKVIHVYHF